MVEKNKEACIEDFYDFIRKRWLSVGDFTNVLIGLIGISTSVPIYKYNQEQLVDFLQKFNKLNTYWWKYNNIMHYRNKIYTKINKRKQKLIKLGQWIEKKENN